MKSWAIIVGINVYPDRANQKPLQGAVADACDFAEWALDPAGGGVASDCLYFWTFPWPTAPGPLLQAHLAGEVPDWDVADIGMAKPIQTRQPKAMEITTTIETVGRTTRGQALDNENSDTRRVYVFLAGHGVRAMTLDRDEETCFLAGDYRVVSPTLAAGLVPCDSFRRALLNKRFDEAILFTDCCRSQTSYLTLRAQQVSDYAGQPTEPCSIAFAAQDNAPAYETTTAPVRGAFSSALMQGLRSHRIGQAGDLHAAELKHYVTDKIKVFTPNKQVPSMRFQPDPDGPLIVSGFPAAAPPSAGPSVDVSALPVGTLLVLNGRDDKPILGILPFAANGAIWELPSLEPGLYSIEIGAGSGLFVVFKHPSPGPIHVP